MNILEKIQNGINLKGHTRIILTDVRDGSQKVSEDSNMISDAVSEILANNFCGLGQFSQLMPLKNLFGGVMMFRDAITESGSNYNIPSDDVNPMVAHAGQTAHSTASPYRGNPNGGETIATDTSIKFVWDFMTNQGNSLQIASCCLVPQGLGDMGIKPFDATQNPISVFGADYRGRVVMTDEIRKQFPVAFGSDGKTYYNIDLNGTSFKEYTMRHDLWKFGIMRNSRTWQQVAVREATLDSGNNKFFFLDSDYYFVAWADTSTHLTIKKISRSDFSITDASISVSSVALYQGTINMRWLQLFAYDGKYLYFPNTDATRMCKIDLAVPANSDYLDGTVNLNVDISPNGNEGYQRVTPIAVSEGLIIGDNYIANGSKLYPIKGTAGILASLDYMAQGNWLTLVRHGAACYGHAFGNYDSRQYGQGNVLFPYFLSTINNLQDPVEKSTSQTMKVEYTLTEV